jgi:membrane-bound lytic murein transglycosylase D
MRKVAVVLMMSSMAAFSLARAQDQSLTIDDDLLRSAQQWAQENLDEDALRVLQSADQEKIKQLLKDLQKEFRGEYVVDLAGLKQAARNALPLLESYEETLPYAVWLRSRLDYLDVADHFRLVIPPPKTEPGKPPKPAPNPTPKMEREVWVDQISREPWPPTANTYVPRLKTVFAAQKAPKELVWVAEVESSFDPRARSPVGATGLFQLMPATAKQYGLRTWPFDQRLNPEASGRAAAQYLVNLHKRFNDWRLALAAYNAGEGTVQGLLKRHKAQSYDAIARYLPAETQMYVPKIEATLLRREGAQLEKLGG